MPVLPRSYPYGAADDRGARISDGAVTCQYNDSRDKPVLRIRRGKGLAGPLPFRLYQGEKAASCLGVFLLEGPEAIVPLRDRRECEVRYALPGSAERVRKVTIPARFPKGGLEITLEATE